MKWFCLKLLSSSSWGCELKYPIQILHLDYFRHPLHEDVSWNTIRIHGTSGRNVSSSSWGCELKCEIDDMKEIDDQSSSSWGCELKYSVRKQDRHLQNVILFMRMWVEISLPLQALRGSMSSSSWGCELKWQHSPKQWLAQSSSSSWGCELKSCNSRLCNRSNQSSSSWGCELKYRGEYCIIKVCNVILFMRMWVEMMIQD